MNVMIFVDGEEQRNENVEIAAFCGDELRGNIRTKHITGTNPTYGDIDSYLANLTVVGNDGDIITFKLYDHNTKTEYEIFSNETIIFETNDVVGTPFEPFHITFTIPHPNNTFTGSGSWNDASNWENSKVPTEKSIVTIDGDALITDNITVYSLSINETKSLTIKDGGVLTVNETLTNADVNALIIEEGGQLIHHNEGVAATFKNEIVVPTGIWGEEDNTGWQFISSPMENVNTSDFIPADGDYDLYMYDGTNEYQWQNFKELTTKTYNFSSNPFNNGWTSIDADGDGLNWEYDDRDGFMTSYSYYDREDVYADNYLVSPQIMVNEGTSLSFKAYVTYDRIPETFKVLLSTSNNDVDDFTEVLGEYSIDNEDAETFSVDLGNYSGQNVYVAFYHYLADDARDGSEQLIIDDVEFVNENSFEKGRGYLVSYQNEDNVAEFKGNLNYLAKGESYQIDLNHYPENILAQFNLIGNPFAFDLTWETDVNINNVYDGYATLDATDGGYVYKENGTIKAGEGFMVRTNETGNNYIRFSKASRRSYRAESYSINIIASNNKGSDNVIIRFDDEVKSGFPKLANFNERLANIYVKEENVNYGILNFNNDVTEIPLYFDAKEMGTYTLTFDVKGDYENLYLHDKMTGEELNLLLENEYKFMANASENTERFVLKLTSDTDSVNENFIFINDDELIISSAGTIQIIDMMGRVVMTEENHNGRINIGGLDNAAYVIRCITENGVKVQKIVVL
ncbi:MAG: choice-of-anchor J domain-containing protein [Bacteroidales bacterium]|nr:choice-of-anchor J domain-containing protein [Bacteroidales bacterium]